MSKLNFASSKETNLHRNIWSITQYRETMTELQSLKKMYEKPWIPTIISCNSKPLSILSQKKLQYHRMGKVGICRRFKPGEIISGDTGSVYVWSHSLSVKRGWNGRRHNWTSMLMCNSCSCSYTGTLQGTRRFSKAMHS